MSPELFSGILVAVLVVAVIANTAWNKLRGNREGGGSPTLPNAKQVIDDYVGDDSDSRFIRELDLAPFKIVSEELGLKKSRRPRKQ